MGKTFKLIYIVATLAFLLAAICFFLEKNDFLGEVIDAKIVKTKIKQDPYFENSLFKTDSQGKSRFRRMDLSSLVSDKRLGKEVFKFEIIKECEVKWSQEAKKRYKTEAVVRAGKTVQQPLV